jgi:hypothetical protein
MLPRKPVLPSVFNTGLISSKTTRAAKTLLIRTAKTPHFIGPFLVISWRVLT